MRHILPWLLLLLVPVLMFPGAIPGSRVVSADDHLSVHHVFQTDAGGRVRHPHLSDPALQFKALRSVVKASVAAGDAPLWNPTIYAGAPLLGDAQSMVGSPVTWLHLMFEEDTAADLAVAWLLLWIGLGSALLIRAMGFGHWSAAIAGAGAMTSPFISVWLLHPHAATAVWLPWILLALERRSGWATALATAGLLMGGHPQTALHVGMLAMAWTVWRVRWSHGLYWVLCGALISAAIWLPFVEEVSRSATVSTHGGNTLAWGQLLDLVWPGWHGHPATESWSRPGWSWADGHIHPGLGVLMLAIAATRGPLGRVIAGIWLTAVVLSVTGLPGPVNHARLAGIAGLLLPIGAATITRTRWAPLLFTVVLASGLWTIRHDQSSLPADAHNPSPAAWTQTLRDHVGSGRIIGLGWAVQPNTGALAGLSDLRGYDLPVSRDTERLQMALNPRPVRPWFRIDSQPSTSLLRFAAVRAIVSPEPIFPQLDLGQAPIFAASVAGPSVRAWKATGARETASPDVALKQIIDDPDASAHPPVESTGMGLPTDGTSTAASNAVHGFRETTFTVDGPLPGLAVLSDAWHPGWTVEVDGERATPLRVGGVFRGVAVGPGEHSVRWWFDPWGWRWGRSLSWLGVIALLIPIVMSRRPRQGQGGQEVEV